MIRYTLKCDQGHVFDSWFASANAFTALADAGHLSCAVCGSKTVAKAMMAPSVRASVPAQAAAPAVAGTPPTPAPAGPAATGGDMTSPPPEVAAALRRLRRMIATKSENVGTKFADEARAIHNGDAPDRMIHGKTTPEQAQSLHRDGIAITPLPFDPGDKLN